MYGRKGKMGNPKFLLGFTIFLTLEGFENHLRERWGILNFY